MNLIMVYLLNKGFFLKNLISCVPQYVCSISNIGQDVLYSAPTYLIKISTFLYLHHNCLYKLFIDLFGTDYLFKKDRFLIIYSFFSLVYFRRIYLKFFINDINSIISITTIFPCAKWYEREVWDMLGVYFIYNDDLRRILTDYGFIGHPLRKDFPLSGFVELRFDESIRAILYNDVKLMQEYRHFNIIMPWNYFSSISYKNINVLNSKII